MFVDPPHRPLNLLRNVEAAMYGDMVRDVEHASGAAGVGVTTFLMNLTDAFIFRPDTGCRNRSEFPTHIVRSGLAIAKNLPNITWMNASKC
jgi:hypothetical protein